MATYGCRPWSGCPHKIAATGPTAAKHNPTATTAASTRCRIVRSPLSVDAPPVQRRCAPRGPLHPPARSYHHATTAVALTQPPAVGEGRGPLPAVHAPETHLRRRMTDGGGDGRAVARPGPPAPA